MYHTDTCVLRDSGGIICSSSHSLHFATVQVRVIVERLARRCGFQAVSQHIPEKDRKLLAHIRKEKQRHERKRQGASEADRVRTSCSGWCRRLCCLKHACSLGSAPDMFIHVQPGVRAVGLTLSGFCGTF